MKRFGSLFSGVGGFDLGFERAGMKCAWTVEYDKQARSVLRKRWPDVPHYEDVHNVGCDQTAPITGRRRASRTQGDCADTSGSFIPLGDCVDTGERNADRTNELAPVDLICGGFPCQDYSVAGKRGGLVGDRGALWWQMHRIIAECRPEWVVGENVPGLLSSNGGRDFLTIITSLVELGYGVTWATLDSQYFGVAQRRRRLFIVGHLGGIARPEILALSEGLRWHPAPSREAGQNVAGYTPSSFGGYREGAGTLRATDIETGGGNHVIAQCLTARDAKGPLPSRGLGNVVTQPVAFTPESVHMDGTREDGTHHPLRCSGHAAVAFNGNITPKVSEDVVPTMGTHGTSYLGVSTPQPRRLTPVECERLQGFPDGWTARGTTDEGDHRQLADGPRYRMMGNAVTVNVAEWIGRRL